MLSLLVFLLVGCSMASSHEFLRQRNLEAYALYNLDAFAVRFLTGYTEKLRTASDTDGPSLRPKNVKTGSWKLVSETGGLNSSLSYPLRSTTQEFLYLGFQNLVDGWLLDLQGGPDGENNNNNNNNDRRLQTDEYDQSRIVQVFSSEGGDSTGEGAYESREPNLEIGTVTNIHNEKITEPPSVSPPVEDYSDYPVPPSFVDVYEGLTHHTMYDHIIMVDLQVKLYLRTDEVQVATAELFAEVTPSIAFKEPFTQADRDTKPTNEDVRKVFGNWMDYLFGVEKDIYLRTLLSHPTQELLQGISKLKVDVQKQRPSSVAAAQPTSSYREEWSDRTKQALVTMLVVLAVIAVLWPLYSWHQHNKRNRELRLQILHGGLSLEGGDTYRDEDPFPDGFSSVRYRDDPSIATSQSSTTSFPRPVPLSTRSVSLDAARHGKDVFPRKPSPSTATAMSALEASDRYLSRHRPDLVPKNEEASSSSSSIFGRVYEIPSNPFEFIYKGFTSEPGNDLGRSAHFPFSSPSRSSFQGRPVSVGSAGTPSIHSHFTPIQNLATGDGGEELDERTDSIAAAAGFAAHTGRSWQTEAAQPQQQQQQHQQQQQQVVTPTQSAETGSLMGNIFRNLSMNSWINSSNTYTSNDPTVVDPDTNPTFSGAEEEIYYDDYPNDPAIFGREIEMETLPQTMDIIDTNEDPKNYNFAFQDFPRKDGTPCLIIDDDTFLSERKRRESAKMIFTIQPDEDEENCLPRVSLDDDDDDDNSISEKKLDVPVCNDTFKKILSQNSVAIDGSSFLVKTSFDDDDSLVVPPLLEGSFLSPDYDPHDVKSPEFQQKLSRLMETKQKRYAQERKNEAIVAANRRKRKTARERERVDRHKAIEKELEDIEAEFSLTMQPLSPKRNGSPAAAISPKPHGRFSPMPSSRYASSPARSTIAGHSPGRAMLGRGHVRHNSLGGNHRRHHTLGASPFRKYSPRPSHQSRPSETGDAGSPPLIADLEAPGDDSKPKFRPVNLYGSDRFSQQGYDDLSLPSISGDAKYPSPQAVIDDILDPRPPSRQFSQRMRSRTPTRASAKLSRSSHRRVSSFDVEDSFGGTGGGHRRSRSSSISGTPTGTGGHHRRNSSHSQGDVFLHGVVAQTRFV